MMQNRPNRTRTQIEKKHNRATFLSLENTHTHSLTGCTSDLWSSLGVFSCGWGASPAKRKEREESRTAGQTLQKEELSSPQKPPLPPHLLCHLNLIHHHNIVIVWGTEEHWKTLKSTEQSCVSVLGIRVVGLLWQKEEEEEECSSLVRANYGRKHK